MSNRPASEPFKLIVDTEREPSSQSEKVDAIYAYLPVIHRDVALTREEAIHAREAAIDARDSADKANAGVEELRTLVIGDHAPRISGVEKKTAEVAEKTSSIHIPTWAKTGGKYGALVAIIPVLEALWPVVKQALKIP